MNHEKSVNEKYAIKLKFSQHVSVLSFVTIVFKENKVKAYVLNSHFSPRGYFGIVSCTRETVLQEKMCSGEI